MNSSSVSAISSATFTPSDAGLLDSVERNPLLSTFGRLLFAILMFFPTLLLRLATFTTISIPRWLFSMFSISLTFTMNFTTLLSLVLVAISIMIWLLRYRLLNMYARLPQEPQRKDPHIDLYPDTSDGDSKPGLGNYLDEFLEAIKVFGYLERPVFHELTRTMQTKKLIAGETLLLEEENGYCLVVDGLVQIFVKSMRDTSDIQDSMDEAQMNEDDSYQEGNQGYQLLTEVKNGASMSSLFSILSLFTEDIGIRLYEEGESNSSIRNIANNQTPMSETVTPGNPASPRIATNSTTLLSRSHLPNVPPLMLDSSNSDIPSRPYVRSDTSKSAHPDILARAVVDTTIAIIPASAFRRLTRVYPRATAHIVQVILTRLQRVTLATAHQYLGMTAEVLQAEKSMNKYTTYDLPNHLRGSALDQLKDKFAGERDRLPPDQGSEGIALHYPKASRRRTSSVLRKETPLSAVLATTRLASTPSHLSLLAQQDLQHVSPGDLLSNIQSSRFGTKSSGSSVHSVQRPNAGDSLSVTNPMLSSPAQVNKHTPIRPTSQHSNLQRKESIDQDGLLRESILECMIKALGLDTSVKDHTQRNPGQLSVEQSPRLVSYDSKRQTAIFNNAFGFIDPYEASTDGDTASVGSFAGSTYGRSLADELIDELEIVHFPKESILVEQGERNPGIYYVVDGFLDVSIPVDEKDNAQSNPSSTFSQPSSDNFPSMNGSIPSASARASSLHVPSEERQNRTQKSLFLIKPGGIAGYIGTVSSYRSFTDITAKTDVYVGFLPRASIERVAEKYPVLLLTMAKRLTSLLPRVILHLDFALEWVQVNAGQVIHHQGDESDAIYIVLNGRLRTVVKTETGQMRLSGEYGQGDSIGELEVLTESPRPATLHAIRDSELAKLPKTLFNSLAQENPSITIQISKLIAERMRVLIESPVAGYRSELAKTSISRSNNASQNLRTVAILPVTAGVPVVEFGARLLAALTQIEVAGGVTSLHQSVILNHLGRHAFSRMGKLKLSQYLADLEEKFGLVLYVADTTVNAPWTQTCIAQADCVLLVGLSESSAAVGEYERFLLGMKTTARKELVLLHNERFSQPGLTRKWLRNRVWINGTHHHIQMPYRVSSDVSTSVQASKVGSAIKQKVQVLQAEIQKYTSRRVRQTPLYSAHTPFKGDMHRLARHLCGRSIGLVLGGGGARGLSQIGVIRALEEAGVPIDIVGGTSIGAFIGALYARDADVVPMYGRAKKFAGRMASKWRFLLDLTYPALSYTTGHEFNRGIYKIFDNSEIEDFWLEFYCNTTNISKNRAEIHTSGYAWRYVRASMSLAGLIPPICDEGSMLLDGGYIDNLTVSHMKSLGADVVFAVDVGALDENVSQQFGDSLSGFWALLHRYNIFSSRPNPPTLAEVQARLAYVSSFDALERAKSTPGCLYMRPPIDVYGTLEFGKFDEIYQVGYAYGKEFLAKLRDKGELKGVVSAWDESDESKGLRRTMAPRRASI